MGSDHLCPLWINWTPNGIIFNSPALKRRNINDLRLVTFLSAKGGVWKIIEYTHHHRPTFEKIKALATLSPLRHPLLFEIA